MYASGDGPHREELMWRKRARGIAGVIFLRRGKEDGIHCIGEKGRPVTRQGSLEAGTGGLTGEGSEGTPLKSHRKESATIPFPFPSLKEPVGKSVKSQVYGFLAPRFAWGCGDPKFLFIPFKT